jgi:hypothetical protein
MKFISRAHKEEDAELITAEQIYVVTASSWTGKITIVDF